MKNYILNKTTILVLLVLSSGVSMISCGTKENHGTDVTMTYSPNPAIVDSTITFNFEVKEDGMMMSVTNFTCEAALGSNKMPITLTEVSSGLYRGTRKFDSAGTYQMNFNFMHSNAADSRKFNCIVN